MHCVLPAVKVKPVRGRVIDPFRGGLEIDDPERFANRNVDTQPLDDLIAAMGRLADVRVVRAGRRFTLGRGHDLAKVTFASAAKRVSLDDASFEGDGLLILQLLHAWIPLFGAVEVRFGSHRELIDGHEPLDAIVKRYETWWVDESLKLAKRLDNPVPAPLRPVHAPPIVSRAQAKQLSTLVALVVLILLGFIWASIR